MDALRGIAMWLGVVLHAVIAYQTEPRAGWPQDANRWLGMDYIYVYLHAFRMPLFFLVAGFFAHFLSQKIGLSAFLQHRWKRIVIPFVLSIIFIVPLCSFVFSLKNVLSTGGVDNVFVEVLNQMPLWSGFYHLWFLYYLILFYVIQVTCQSLNFSKVEAVKFNEGLFWASTLFLVGVQYYFYKGPVEAWTGLIPKAGQIVYYGYFYLLGFLIFGNPDFLFAHKTIRYSCLAAGILLIPCIIHFYDDLNHLGQSALLSFQTNLLIIGHIALFMHLFKNPSKRVRYLSDASYWFYLIHLPLVVVFQLYFLQFDWAPWIKALLNIAITTFISLISYDYLVRYTWIGRQLNGSKKRGTSLRSIKM